MSLSESSLAAACQYGSVGNHSMIMEHYAPTAFAKEDIRELIRNDFPRLACSVDIKHFSDIKPQLS
jgi:hypothetical protein